MNLLKQAERILRKSPTDYGVKDNAESFRKAIDVLNHTWPAGCIGYHMYLKSKLWKMRREIYQEYYQWCQVCKERKGIQLHHLSYAHVSQELPEELQLVCKHCHFILERGKHE